MPAPTRNRNRPYVIHVLHLASGSTHVERVALRRGARFAKCHGLDRVGPTVPRSRRTYVNGTTVEFRYVDPRPGAPDCISPRTQEV